MPENDENSGGIERRLPIGMLRRRSPPRALFLWGDPGGGAERRRALHSRSEVTIRVWMRFRIFAQDMHKGAPPPPSSSDLNLSLYLFYAKIHAEDFSPPDASPISLSLSLPSLFLRASVGK